MKGNTAGKTWRVRCLRNDYEWQGHLVADWEVDLDPISDDYTPDDTDAAELLRIWASQVREHHPDELIPIYWFVASPDQAKFEQMPFQHHRLLAEDFLSFNTWPTESKTGQPLNWLTLPVVDKQWNKKHSDKGGFIQEATGWKPSILQPTVYLPTLLSVFQAARI